MTHVASIDRDLPLGDLLRRVERGEEVVLLRGGRPVAKVVPVPAAHDATAAQAAAGRLRALARELGLDRFDWDEWRSYRDAGRR